MKNLTTIDFESMFGASEIYVEDYCVDASGLYSPLGHRIGDPLLVTGCGHDSTMATVYCLPGHDEGAPLHVKDVDPVAIGTALVLMGYRAEVGRLLEVTDYVRFSWNNGDGPVVTVRKDQDAIIDAFTRPAKPASEPVSAREQEDVQPGYLLVKDIPWLGKYFHDAGKPGLHRVLGRKLSEICRQDRVIPVYLNCGVHSEGMYPVEVIEDFRLLLDADPSMLVGHRL